MVVDKARWQGVKLEVAHAVGANHHRCILFVEGVDNLLEGFGRGIEVVGVELYGKASAAVVVDGLVPAASNAQVGALGDDVYEALIMKALQQFGGLIGRVVIHHDDIELKAGFLREGAVDSVADGLLTIVDGDDDGGLVFELLLVEVGTTVVGGVDLGSYLLQMGCGSLFHLYLYLAIGGIHVVELLDA